MCKVHYNLPGFAVGAPTLSKSVTMPPGIEISLEETTKTLHTQSGVMLNVMLCVKNGALRLTLFCSATN